MNLTYLDKNSFIFVCLLQGAATRGLAKAVARRRACHQEQEACGIHQRRAGQHTRVREGGAHGRDQLLVRAQEAARQASSARAHQGDHAPRQSHRRLPGRVHGGRDLAVAGGQVPLLASFAQSQEAHRDQLLAPAAQHDHAAHHSPLSVARRAQDARLSQAHRGRLSKGVRTSF